MTALNEYFATSQDEAEKRYQKYKNVDPFPGIDRALLSSAHIEAYIAKTGMIYPYFPDNDKGKKITPAALKMTVGPEVLYWDKRDRQQYSNDLTTNDLITLRPNSITFLRTFERFRVPDYIAIRFNFRIKHVHRGLLLGTGPIIDPGFKGYPMIPVHNLTDNRYDIRVGEEFINVEFTKISDIKSQPVDDDGLMKYPFEYQSNKGKTCDYSFTEYIDKSVPSKRVKSSLSSVIDKARNLVKKQEKKVRENEKKIFWSVFIGIVSLVVAAIALIYGGYQLTVSASDIINNTRERLDVIQSQSIELDNQSIEIEKLKSRIDVLETIISKNKKDQ
jgi:deoxycytidine triphosphate deaminase